MRLRKAGVLLLILMLVQVSSIYAAEKGYWSQLGSTFVRGVKNVVNSPYEIPYTIQQHDQSQSGNPRAFRDAAGFFDGVFRTLTRLGCGVWDMAWAFVPGDQQGLPIDPETFF